MLAGFTHRPVVELSERLAALAPAGLGHAFYGSDGASATEIALKMASTTGATAARPAKTRLRRASPAAITARRSARSRSPTSRSSATPTRRCSIATRSCPRPTRAAAPGESARDVAERAARRSTRISPRHHATTAALIVEPLVQGACGHGDVRPALPCARPRALHALRRAADRRRDHDRLRAHRHAVRVRAGGRSRRTSSACRRASPAATCRCRACSPPTPSTPRSTPTTSRAASCIRIRTPATRSPAARRSRCSTSSATTT